MSRRKKWLNVLATFGTFFGLAAFMVSCCFFLFLEILRQEYSITFDEAHIQLAAKLTFANVVLLTVIFTVMDILRRRFLVERPVEKILEATKRLTAGDFTARIEPIGTKSDAYGFNAIIHDFNQMALELSGTETLRSDFVANVSHELKTPLAVISNYATMLQSPALTEKERMEYARSIHSASRGLADLITNILKLNRLENQQIFPDTVEFDLSGQLCQCMLGFEEIWEEKGIEIDTDIPDSLHIRSDPELLALVWNNLLSNAMKFTPEGGTVSLRLKRDGDFAVVTVADTGCGMTAREGRHIFEKFYQADTSHATRGNGLGLALVKRVVDITGSAITVQSTPGEGSAFTVRLGGVV